MSTQPLRIYKNDLEKLKIAAASSGKEEKEILHEILLKAVPEDVRDELLAMAKARTPPKRKGRETVPVQPTERIQGMSERIKAAIADAVELRVFTKYLGIDLSSTVEQPRHPQYPPYPSPYYQPQQPQAPKKDIKEFVMEIKALESLEKKETDPEIKNMLRELKDIAKEQMKRPDSPKSGIRQRLDELKEYAMTMRIFGTPDEAKKAEDLWRSEMKEIRETLHQSQLDSIKREAEWRQLDLQRQINEIRSAPTEFDQITRISALAGKDPAIRAYMNKKLGIEKGEPMTPERLGKYIENIKVPVGEIIKGIYNFVQQRKAAAELPPPQTMPPTMPAAGSEEELARRTFTEGFPPVTRPTAPSVGTFAEGQPPTKIEVQKPPEETGLPPEETQPPPPPSSTPPKKKPPKKKGEKLKNE